MDESLGREQPAALVFDQPDDRGGAHANDLDVFEVTEVDGCDSKAFWAPGSSSSSLVTEYFVAAGVDCDVGVAL